jgi:hypothetical protein
MQIINLFLLSLCLSAGLAEDDADYVDASKLPFSDRLMTKNFFAGYLSVGSGRSYYYVYHHS